MARDYGKAFEAQFKKDFMKIPLSTIDRIYDSVSGYKQIKNVCDFVCYRYPNIFYIECKSVSKGNTFALTRLTQYESLIKKKGVPGVRVGAVIWFIEKQKVFFVPISTFEKLLKHGKKSFNIKMEGDEYYLSTLIPSKPKRTFMDSDYTVLLDMEDSNGQ